MTVATSPAVQTKTTAQTYVSRSIPPAAPVSGPTRIRSIDALRGFDMFWIMGPYVGHKMVLGISKWIWGSREAWPAWIRYHFDHPRWEGFAAWDLIMPLFLFVVGVAMPFSIGRRIDEGAGRTSIYLKMIRRVALLWILGMISQGNLLEFKLDRLRLYSNTLQSIAAGYLIATIVLVELRNIRWHFAVTAGLIVLYWGLMSFVPFQGHRGEYGEQNNLAILIDKALMGHFQDGTTYTWILSSLGFGATVVMGVLAGELLKSMSMNGWTKAGILAASGAICLALGWGWKLIPPPMGMPMIKHIWSGPMILWAGGWSLLLLGLFYAIIDVLGFKAWSYFFVVIGANAIVAYMSQTLFNIWGISQKWFGGLTAHFGRAGDFWLAFGAAAITWVGLWVLYRNKIFVRV